MAYFEEDDVVSMMDDGEVVTIAGLAGKGLVSIVDEEMLKLRGYSRFIGKSIIVHVKTGAFPGLAVGATAVVRGITYKVHTPLQEGDGALTQVLLAYD